MQSAETGTDGGLRPPYAADGLQSDPPPARPRVWLRRDDLDSGISAERQQVPIAADDIFSAGGEGAGDDLVVIGVARRRAGRWRRVIDDAGETEKVGAERRRR
jgi:hypothetical protein